MAKNNFDEELKTVLKTDAVPDENLILEVKQKIMSKNKISPLKVLLKTAAVAAISMSVLCAGVFAAVNVSETAAAAMYTIPIIGKMAKVMTVREYNFTTENNENFNASIKQPEIDLGKTEAEKQVNKLAEDYINEIVSMYREEEAATEGMGHYQLTTDYEVLTDNDDYFSMKIWTTLVMGGSNSFEKYFTIDKKADKIITLADLFDKDFDYKTYIYNEILKQMKENMAKDDACSYFIPESSDINDGNFTEITGDENFYINESGNIVICFDKYDVAPGYMGIVSFEIKR